MDVIQTLGNEHGLIRQFADNLTVAVERIEGGQRPSAAFIEKAVEFARGFADEYHHFKEEHVLFVRLAQKKRGELDARLDALRYQHERSRELVSAMSRSLDGYIARDDRLTSDLLESMAAYAALLRQHIHVEDHEFYPLARTALDADDMEALEEEFDKAREKHGPSAFERSHKLVVDMGSILAHLR